MTNDESNLNEKNSNDETEKQVSQRGSEESAGGGKKNFDLEERTSVFGECVIRLAKKIPVTAVNTVLITQFVKAGTSIGANYGEANDAESKKDFRHKIGICRKESKETKYWLRMIAISEPGLRSESAKLWQEAKELNLIFGAIRRKTDGA